MHDTASCYSSAFTAKISDVCSSSYILETVLFIFDMAIGRGDI